MISTPIRIINKYGLHARACAKFVSTAAKFQSQLEVIKDKKRINGKSIMAIMMLAAGVGSDIILEIEGPDEQEMTKAIVELINNRFYEEE